MTTMTAMMITQSISLLRPVPSVAVPRLLWELEPEWIWLTGDDHGNSGGGGGGPGGGNGGGGEGTGVTTMPMAGGVSRVGVEPTAEPTALRKLGVLAAATTSVGVTARLENWMMLTS